MWGRRRARGFSLIEILIALAVMSIALMALVSVLVSSMQAQGKNDSFATAHQIADQTHERLAASLQTLEPSQANSFWRAGPDSAWSLGPAPETVVDGVTFVSSVTSSPILSGGLPVGSQGGDSDNVARLVTVQVRWSDDLHKAGQGRQQVSARRIVSRSEQ